MKNLPTFSNKLFKKTPSKKFFARNRQSLLKKLKPNSIAILASNYPIYTNGDGTLPYIQNNDLWYFTGIDQDQTILFLIKSDKIPETEILFLTAQNPQEEIWNGTTLSVREGKEISGIQTIKETNQLDSLLKKFVFAITHIYYNLHEHPRADFYKNRNHDLMEECQKKFPLHLYERLSPLISSLRMIKDQEEITLIQEAIHLTYCGYQQIIPLLKEGIPEKYLEAEIVKEFTRSQGEYAFSPIIASGKNSCTLHYISNHHTLHDGIVLIDIGAKQNHYSGDITRCFPLSNNKTKSLTFNKRQRQVYQSVLNTLKRACAIIKIGLSIKEYQKTVEQFMQEELINLGLITTAELKNDFQIHQKYFMHGVSHFLGLDVHDVGDYHGTFKSGMVITCEPGIYIPEEGLSLIHI